MTERKMLINKKYLFLLRNTSDFFIFFKIVVALNFLMTLQILFRILKKKRSFQGRSNFGNFMQIWIR